MPRSPPVSKPWSGRRPRPSRFPCRCWARSRALNARISICASERAKVQRVLALARIVERRARDRDHAALPYDAEPGVGGIDHLCSPGVAQRPTALDKKSAISEFPKGRKYLISLSFRGKASVRPAQVGGFDVNIVIHGSTAVRGRGDLVAYRWALWKLTAPWTHRTRPPHLGKRCAFSTSSTGPFPSNHSRKTPKGPKIALGNPDRPKKSRSMTSSPIFARNSVIGVWWHRGRRH